jgi:hypothetical protein
MSLTVKIRGDATHLEKVLRGVNSSVSGVGKSIASFAAGGAGLGVVLAGIATASAGISTLFNTIKDASGQAAGVESLTMQFETLLGSTEAAKARMEELVDFAASTPFEVSELSATSKLLQTMGGTLLATGEGLRMVGDAAAIAGQPIGEVGLHIGRIFNAITSGTSAGESVSRLQELGLITGKVKREFEALAEAQKSGKQSTLDANEAMKMLRGVLSSTDGAMARLASTTEGKLSNLQDNISQLKVAFGTGFNDGLRVALDATNNFLPQLQESLKSVGVIFGNAITDAVNGNYEIFISAGVLIGEAVKAGFMDVTGNIITDAFRNAATGMGGMVGTGTEAAAGMAANALVGPKRSMADRVSDIKAELAPAILDMRQASYISNKRDADRMVEELIKTRKATEQLIEKGIKITRDSVAQEILTFSR